MPPRRKAANSKANPAEPEQATEPASNGNEPTNKSSEEPAVQEKKEVSDNKSEEKPSSATADAGNDDAATKARERQERFKALQARAVSILSLCCGKITAFINMLLGRTYDFVEIWLTNE